jgi:hypothetical protein
MATAASPPFVYQELFEAPNKVPTTYRKLTGDYVKTIDVAGKKVMRSRLPNLYSRRSFRSSKLV